MRFDFDGWFVNLFVVVLTLVEFEFIVVLGLLFDLIWLFYWIPFWCLGLCFDCVRFVCLFRFRGVTGIIVCLGFVGFGAFDVSVSSLVLCSGICLAWSLFGWGGLLHGCFGWFWCWGRFWLLAPSSFGFSFFGFGLRLVELGLLVLMLLCLLVC